MLINSKDNKKVKQWKKYQRRKYREQDKCFIVEGEHLINEAIASDCLKQLVIREGSKDSFDVDNTIYVSDEIMDDLSSLTSSNPYLGICEMDSNDVDISKMKRVLLLDAVQDPGNVGTIIRTAYSFGFDLVVLGEGTCDPYNEKCIQASQGAIFKQKVIKKDLLSVIDELHDNNYYVVGTDLKESNYLKGFEYRSSLAIVVGNEGSGVSEEILGKCDSNIKIEMENFESLNVAVAASICMYMLKK